MVEKNACKDRIGRHNLTVASQKQTIQGTGSMVSAAPAVPTNMQDEHSLHQKPVRNFFLYICGGYKIVL